jgi:2,4-dienoyl-CoA reductase-like NADH-dependent reductase (Old Yellow Enzyme family)
MPSISDAFVLPCGVRVPNRLCKAAMTENLADDYNRATEKLCNLYRTWSRGGSGILITGNVSTRIQTCQHHNESSTK